MVGENILIVDDVEIVCESICKLLANKGYKADIALNGDEAVKQVKTKKYDLVFMDLVMPYMDGIETCKKIKKVSPDTYVVLMTGKVGEDLNEKQIDFIKAGGEIYYLYKPFIPGEILKVTKEVLGKQS